MIQDKSYFATYNISQPGDSRNLGETYIQLATQEDQDKLLKNEAKAREVVRSHIADMASVIALQDGVKDDSPEVQGLKEKGFQVFIEGDVGIAVDAEKFSLIEHKQFNIQGVSVAFATAIDKQTNKKVGFASIQVSGYDLENPKNDTWGKNEGIKQSTTLAETISKASQTFGCDKIIVGGDVNTNPNLSPEHFTPWTKKGFTVLTPSEKTNITKNPAFAEKMFDRTLDHIFVWEKPTWSNLLSRIYRAIFRNKEIEATTKGAFQPNFDPNQSPSDHAPVYLKTTKATWSVFQKTHPVSNPITKDKK